MARSNSKGTDTGDLVEHVEAEDAEHAETVEHVEHVEGVMADVDGPQAVKVVPRPGGLEAVYERQPDGSTSRRVRKAGSEG